MATKEIAIFGSVFGIIGVGFGIGSLLYCEKLDKELKEVTEGNNKKFEEYDKKFADTSNTLDTAIDRLAKMTHVDVEDAVIKKAIDKAVDEEIDARVSKYADQAVAKVGTDISSKVSDAINDAYNDVKGDVKEELLKQVRNTSADRIYGEAIKDIKHEYEKKIENEMNDYIKTCKNRFDDVTKVYSDMIGSVKRVIVR